MNEFEGKIALVTGGLTGIGQGIARGLESAGATVIAAGIPNLDVTSQESVSNLVGGITHLDILVNCAGIIRRDEEFELPIFEQVIDVNLNGTMRMCTACRPLLACSQGTIVNIASMLTFFGGPRVPAYSASKGGIAQLTRSLAVAWAPEGIRVNAVAPGWIRTPMTRRPAGRHGALGISPRADTDGPMGPAGRCGGSGDILVLESCSIRDRSRPSGRRRLLSFLTMSQTTHPLSPDQIVVAAVPEDERLWVPQAPNVWFRPLMLNTMAGQWCNLLRVRKAGILSRHRHPAPVHGYVIKGAWRYLEHDWVARAGDYVFEPPGETHTLYVDEDVDEMITFFNISGCMYYVDAEDRHTGFEDVFTKIDMCRKHYTSVGLGEGFVDQFIR